MAKKDQLIKNIQRCLKNKASIDKYLNKLRQHDMLDIFLTIGKGEMTILMYYVKENKLAKVKELLIGLNPANPIIKNKEGFTALAMAILSAGVNEEYDLNIIDELLKYNPVVQLTIMTSVGSCLYLATLNERTDIVKKLVPFDTTQLFYDIVKINSSPLHQACNKNLLEIVETLLLYEPEKQILQQNKEGEIPLHIALENGNIILVKRLLKHNTKQQILMQTTQKKNSFDFAAQSGSDELINWLITEYPEVLDLRSTDGFTPLHVVCRLGNLKLTQLILSKKPEQTVIPDDYGIIPIFDTCMNDQVPLIKELLKYNIFEQVSHQNKMFDQTIIHILCFRGWHDALNFVLKIVVNNNIDIGAILLKQDKFGYLPLHHLLMSKNLTPSDLLEVISILLTWKTNQQLTSQNGKEKNTPLLQSLYNNQTYIVDKLLSYNCPEQLDRKNGNGISPLWYAALFSKDIQIFNSLLATHNEKQVENAIWNGITLLHMLAGKIVDDHINRFEAVLRSGFSSLLINIKEPGYGNTPLHVAVSNRNLPACMALIEHKAKMEIQDNKGWAAIHIACWAGNVDIINLLIQHKANLNVTTESGTTPLHIAAAYGNLSIVKLLIERFVAIDPKDKFGQTPLISAVIYGHTVVVEYLLSNKADPNIDIEIKKSYVSPLRMAISAVNLELLKILVKYNADLQKPISKISGSPTYIDLIINNFASSPKVYRKIKEIIPALPSQQLEEKTSVDFLTNFNTELSISSRQYLSSMGYAKDLIDEFEEESKQNKRLLNKNQSAFQYNEKKVEKIIYWLNGTITSEPNFIYQINSSGDNKSYCYLDIDSLVEQGCDISKIRNRRLKFDAYHIKKLDNEKAKFSELIKLSTNHDAERIIYTHELKINKIDRVLLFCIEAEKSSSSLYIGARYIAGGFHTTGKINSFLDSNHSNSSLEIKWPSSSLNNIEPAFFLK